MRTILLLFLTLATFGCGSYSRPNQMTQSAITPVVAAIMPASQLHGGSNFTLTVTAATLTGTQ